MKTHCLRAGLTLGVCILSSAIATVRAATSLDFSTTAAGSWTVSGGGATNATPDVINGAQLALTSDGLASGTPVAGFNNSAFDGFWTANYAFTLPADAADATLAYSTFAADDRAVLFLNGKQITDAASDGAGTGTMVLSSGGSASPFTFTNTTSSGTITSGFNVGGANTLTAVINNTTGGRNGTPSPLVGSNGTDFSIAGTVTFATGGSGGNGPAAASVPLPPAAWTGLAGLLALTLPGVLRRRRYSSTH